MKQKVMEAVKKEVRKKAAPRAMDEINADYSKYCGELGQMKYNYQCLETQMNSHMQRIMNLKQEGLAREEMDKVIITAGDVSDTPS